MRGSMWSGKATRHYPSLLLEIPRAMPPSASRRPPKSQPLLEETSMIGMTGEYQGSNRKTMPATMMTSPVTRTYNLHDPIGAGSFATLGQHRMGGLLNGWAASWPRPCALTGAVDISLNSPEERAPFGQVSQLVQVGG